MVVALLHRKVRQVISMDYASAATERCRRRILNHAIANAAVLRGDVSQIPLPDDSVDKIVCISVFQYLDDADVGRCLDKFRRVTRPTGVLILHVKNLSSLYLSTLTMAKRLKRLLGWNSKEEYLRPYRWCMDELKMRGYQVIDYNSLGAAAWSRTEDQGSCGEGKMITPRVLVQTAAVGH